NLGSLDSFRYGIALDTLTYGICLILSLLLYLETYNFWYLVALTTFVQFSITASYYPTLPFIALIGGLCAFLFSVYRKEGRQNLFSKYRNLALASLVGFLMAAPNWVSLIELLRVNYRRAFGS